MSHYKWLWTSEICLDRQEKRTGWWPLMSANLIMISIKYECKLHKRRDQIRLQNWSYYVWSLKDHIWVQPGFQRRPDMSENIRSVQPLGLSAIFEFWLIFGPWCKNLHSYLVPFKSKFAVIFGPCCDWVCTHIWSSLESSLHSHVVLRRNVSDFEILPVNVVNFWQPSSS